MHVAELRRQLHEQGCAEVPEFLAAAVLPGWRLDWHYYSQGQRGASANLTPSPALRVYGALLTLGAHAIAALDRDDAGYRRIDVSVERCDNGERVTAHAYQVLPEQRTLRRQLPTRGYRNLMLRGAAALALPGDYLLHLQSMPVAEAFWSAGIHFACQQSGKCCTARGDYGYVYVDSRERTAMAKHLGISLATLRADYLQQSDGLWHLRDPDKDCMFLEDRRCRIYEARPGQCRTWPFWPENLAAEHTWQEDVAAFCPGVGKGESFSAEEIHAIASEVPRP
jgi:Fe-S-cluster containining protein